MISKVEAELLTRQLNILPSGLEAPNRLNLKGQAEGNIFSCRVNYTHLNDEAGT